MRTNRKRVALPFLFRAADCRGAGGALIARSYGNEVSAVFTRAGQKVGLDSNGRLFTLAHSQPPLALVASAPAFVPEGAGTNLCLRSQEFDNASWTKTSASVSANSVLAPDGTLTADTLTASAATTGSVSQVVTYTADGVKVFAVYLKQGTATTNRLAIVDTSPVTTRHRVEVTWTAGVPTLATIAGTGVLFAVEACRDGWYRIAITADGVVAAGVNNVLIYPDSTAGTGTVYAWGAQTENAVAPSSYIATTTATVTRAADSCYFPFLAVPQEMTVYVRGIERMNASVAAATTTGVVQIGNAANDDAKLYISRGSGVTGYRLRHDPGTSTETSSVGTGAVTGDVVELRGVLGADGSATIGASVNSAAESTNGPSTAQALASAWSGSPSSTRLYLNSLGSGNVGMFAFTHVAVAFGTKTLAEMRTLAEVY